MESIPKRNRTKLKKHSNGKAPIRLWIGRCPVHGKLQFETEVAAQKQCKDVRKRTGAKLEPYLCIYCQLWHMGHKRDDKDRLRRRAVFPPQRGVIYRKKDPLTKTE